MGNRKPNSNQLPQFPFALINLDAADMEILNAPEGKGTKIIYSAASSDVGVGNLIVTDIDDVRELGRDAGNEDSELYIKVKTTEGPQTYEIHDFKII